MPEEDEVQFIEGGESYYEEQWVSLTDNTKEKLGPILGRGLEVTVMEGMLVKGGIESKRVNQVNKALSVGYVSERDRLSREKEETTYPASFMVIGEADGEMSFITFLKFGDATDEEYADSRDKQLIEVNRLLETFDCSALPVHTDDRTIINVENYFERKK